MNRDKRTAYILIVLITVAAVIAVFSLDPIPQNPVYHYFSDSSSLFGIPNFWNVVSNLPFLIVAVVAFYQLFMLRILNIDHSIRYSYVLLFAGVFLLAFGSSYYHLNPVNQTLLWDRLPMAIAFMALFSIVISEYLSLKAGRYLLVPLIVIGIVSVLYWHWLDDLRLYALVQFLPAVLIPVIIIFSDSVYDDKWAYWLLLASYVFAKLFEHFDYEIKAQLVYIGGHPFKHVVAALGVYVLVRAYSQRRSG